MRIYRKNDRKVLINPILATLALSLFLAPVSWAKKEELPEVDSNGLHLVKDTKAKIVYAKPGANLDKYTKVKLLDCFSLLFCLRRCRCSCVCFSYNSVCT